MTTPPPLARPIPAERRQHGDVVTDDYAWLAAKDNPEVIAYLTAENAYTDEATAHLAGLRDTVFAEIKARTQETDLTVPARKGGWWYYTRTVEGQQYPIYCRRPARPDEVTPPMADHGRPLDGEQILLDGNELAGDSSFFELGAFSVSPDGKRLGYSTDFRGDERFTLRIKDLGTGAVLDDEIPDTFYGCAWSLDGSAVFYVTVDDAWRPYRVWRHTIGTPAADDVIVFEEPDERFWVGVSLTRSERYLVIKTESRLTGEAWLLDAADPGGELRVVAPRRQGVEYDVEHQPDAESGDRLLILHNDQAENFELAAAPAARPQEWQPLIGHREDTRLLGRGRLRRAHGGVVPPRRADRPDRVPRRLGPGDPAPRADLLGVAGGEPGVRVGAVPAAVRIPGHARVRVRLRRRDRGAHPAQAAAGAALPRWQAVRPDDYEQHREWAVAGDGTRIPISLICPEGTPQDGSAPCLLYGYGSYESSVDPYFSTPRLSLLDRGFVFAIAHVRGGGEMGRRWYEEGKQLHKGNTFTDFTACAAHLVERGWTSRSRLIARGASAGGLLMGVTANRAPAQFAGIVAEVPFVDPVNTMLDPSLPLTINEWEEWGDPRDPEVYAYMKAYSPYENVTGQQYPPILITGGLNDTRVLYHEPAKWVARLRAAAKGGPFLLRMRMEAGHGGRSGRYDAWREEALVTAWIIDTAGAGEAQPGAAAAVRARTAR